jgi:hypothetical protein
MQWHWDDLNEDGRGHLPLLWKSWHESELVQPQNKGTRRAGVRHPCHERERGGTWTSGRTDGRTDSVDRPRAHPRRRPVRAAVRLVLPSPTIHPPFPSSPRPHNCRGHRLKTARARAPRQSAQHSTAKQSLVRRAAALPHPVFGDFIFFTRSERKARRGSGLELRVLYRGAPCDGSLARQHLICSNAPGARGPSKRQRARPGSRQVERVGGALLPRPDRGQRQRGEERAMLLPRRLLPGI